MAFLGYRTAVFRNTDGGWSSRPETGWLSHNTTIPPDWVHIEIGGAVLIFNAKSRERAIEKSEKWIQKTIDKNKKENQAKREIDYIYYKEES